MTNLELFNKHSYLIDKITSKHLRRIKGLPTFSNEDLYQIASMGLFEACNTFDDTKGVPFQAYASKMMNWTISNALKNKKTLVKFPYYFQDIWALASKNYFTYNKFDMELMADMCKYSYQQIEEAMKWYNYNSPAYLDCELEEGSNLYDKVIGSEMDDTTVIVEDYLSSLTTKQKSIVTMLMDGKTQAEIGEELGISQPHVHRIIKSLQKTWLDNYEGE